MMTPTPFIPPIYNDADYDRALAELWSHDRFTVRTATLPNALVTTRDVVVQ